MGILSEINRIINTDNSSISICKTDDGTRIDLWHQLIPFIIQNDGNVYVLSYEIDALLNIEDLEKIYNILNYLEENKEKIC